MDIVRELERVALVSDVRMCNRVYRARLRAEILHRACIALRDADCPIMPDKDVFILSWMAFLATIPIYRETMKTFCEAMAVETSHEYRTFFARLVRFAHTHADHAACDLASDGDWSAWIASL